MRWPWSRDKRQVDTEQQSEEARVSMEELTRRLESVTDSYLRMLRRKASDDNS